MNLSEEMTGSALESLISGLNPPQSEAVRHVQGPILVLAGAGSGKTRVLTFRVAQLVLRHGVSPGRILAVTFTNKAAEEMKGRLRNLLGERSKELWVATFHSAALRMLRRHATLLGYKNDFLVYDEQDSSSTLKSVLKELNVDTKRFPPQLFSSVIDQSKNANIDAESFKPRGNDFQSRLIAEVYVNYQRALLKANAMDFGDLLVNGVRLLKNPEILRLYQRTIEFVLVDEYQDTNEVQYQFIRLISAPQNNLLVVGDDDQSIYAFRGATIRNILEFEKDFNNTKVVRLEQNYRSTGHILNAAHGVIEKNRGRKAKKLWTDQGDGLPLKAYVAADEMDEAAFIAREIAKQSRAGLKYSDCAIFYRTNAQSRAIEEELIRSRIPYKIFGGLKFYERKEIKDVLSYLRVVVNPFDPQAFTRAITTPPRGIGAQTLEQIEHYAASHNVTLIDACKILGSGSSARARGLAQFAQFIEELIELSAKLPLSELIAKIVHETKYDIALQSSKDPNAESRVENVRELEGLARSIEDPNTPHAETLRGFLDRVSLTSSADMARNEQEQKAGAVSMMTLHLAKGLEFPLVFLTGMEEGLLPHYRSIEDGPAAIEEERRLCYVGITRAMRELFVTRAETRGMFSAGGGFGVSGLFRDTSRFAFDIPPGTLESLGTDFTARSTSFKDDDLEFVADEDDQTSHSFGARSRREKSGSSKVYGLKGQGARLPDHLMHKLANAEELPASAKAIAKRKKAETPEIPPGLTLADVTTLVPGQRVVHKVFGYGVVERLGELEQDDPDDREVFINFDKHSGTKKLIVKYAKIWLA